MAETAKENQERSSRDGWLRAALELLGEKGVNSLTIDALCKRLGLTKGSFYWHFNGRQELLSAVVERYAHAHHREIRKRLEESGLDDWQQMEQVRRDGYEKYAKIDHAMRIWAEQSEETARAIKRSDARTLRFLTDKLVNLGVAQSRARMLANLVLCVGIGFSIAQPSLGGRKEYDQLDSLIQNLISMEIERNGKEK